MSTQVVANERVVCSQRYPEVVPHARVGDAGVDEEDSQSSTGDFYVKVGAVVVD